MISDLELGPDVLPLPERPPFRILSLSGGGYRGLFAAEVLARVENLLNGVSVASQFSLIAGTSVGGLIAAGLACGRSPQKLCELMRSHGPRIFDARLRLGRHRLPVRKPSGPLGGLLWSKYDSLALREAIDDILADQADLLISALEPKILLVATCVTTRAPVLISNLSSKSTVSDISLRDALLATSAAPGYFPALDLTTRSLADGGLVANAPDMICLTQTLEARLASLQDCWLLSLGTAVADPATQSRRIGRRGLLSWVTGDLLPTILFGQERLIVDQATILLRNRMLRIDALPSPEQAPALTLDNSDEVSSNTLALLAETAISRVSSQCIQNWFACRP
jgi:patatin-like phospholipase/acyl hydrolase